MQASGQAGDGQKGSICALPVNASAPSDCSAPLWCRAAEVPPLHGSGYGWCTDEVKHVLGTAAMSTSVSPACLPFFCPAGTAIGPQEARLMQCAAAVLN